LVFSLTAFGAGADSAKTRPQFPGKYILASLALPGAGEMLKGHQAKGEAFLWTDATVWLSYGGLTAVGAARNQSARLFARRYSGASVNVRKDEYYVALERYDNSDLYNEDIRREARELYPDDPDRQKAYAQTHGYYGDEAWDWGSDSLRVNYWEQRKGARGLLHTAAFFVGAALLDRLASALDVAFFTPDRHAPHATRHSTIRDHLGAVPTYDRPGLELVYRF
jgi:hypothetical protein